MSLKVLYVAHNHPSVRPGGAEQHALELHRAMSRAPETQSVLLAKGGPPVGSVGRTHEGTYVAPVANRADEYFLYTDGYSFDYFNGTMTDKDFYTQHFRAFLMATRPDVVHFQHTLFLGYDLIREVRNTLPHAAIVYTLHEYLPICAHDGQMVRTGSHKLCDGATPQRCHGCFAHITPQAFFLRKRFIQAQFDLVDVFLAPSHFLMQRYIEWGIPPHKIRFEEYGRKFVKRVPDDHRESRTRLGFFGQFSPFKGVQVLMEAMRLIQSAGRDGGSRDAVSRPGRSPNGKQPPPIDAFEQPRVSLKLHGANLDIQDGEFKRTFARLLEETTDSVTLMGRYRQKELAELMRGVDWVVVPSIWWENSPLVIQEAFANGRPVICSDIGGMAEKVTDGVNGIHFKVGDAASLAGAIRRAVQSPGTWEQMRRGIPEVYRMDDQVSKLRDLYQVLVAKRNAGALAHATVE
jgi:glycosyltransferase involved in cell wall biosynthesis